MVYGREDDLVCWHDPVRVVVGEANPVPRGHAPALADSALLHRVHAALVPVVLSQSPALVGAPVDRVPERNGLKRCSQPGRVGRLMVGVASAYDPEQVVFAD